MELHAAEDHRAEPELRDRLSGFEEYASRFAGIESESIARGRPRIGRGAAHESRESIFRTDSGVIVTRRPHYSSATAAAGLSALHQRRAVPGQCGRFRV